MIKKYILLWAGPGTRYALCVTRHDFIMTFGDFIREKRIEKGYKTRAAFAKAISVSSTYTGLIEKNIKRPSYKVIARMEKVLGVSRDILLEKAGYEVEKFSAVKETEPQNYNTEFEMVEKISEKVFRGFLKKLADKIDEKEDFSGKAYSLTSIFSPGVKKYPLLPLDYACEKFSSVPPDFVEDWIYMPDIYNIDADFVLTVGADFLPEERIFEDMLIFVKKKDQFGPGDLSVWISEEGKEKSLLFRRFERKGKKEIFLDEKGRVWKGKGNVKLSGKIVYKMYDPREFSSTELLSDIKKVICKEEVRDEINIEKEVAAWNNKGIDLEDNEKYEEAIFCFNKALELDPEDAIVLNNKAFALEHMGLYEEAGECYNKAIELAPDDEVVRHNRDSFLKSREDGEDMPEGRDTRYWYNLKKDSLFDYDKVVKMYRKYKN